MNELVFPDGFLFHPEHVWLRVNPDGTAHVGISDFAQEQLGEVAFVDLPAPGAEFEAGAEFGTVESIKAVNSLYMPVSGKVLAVNEALADEPSLVNTAPYADGWMLHIAPAAGDDASKLMPGDAYRATLE
jgi:glycine cleavage system H protein